MMSDALRLRRFTWSPTGSDRRLATTRTIIWASRIIVDDLLVPRTDAPVAAASGEVLRSGLTR